MVSNHWGSGLRGDASGGHDGVVAMVKDGEAGGGGLRVAGRGQILRFANGSPDGACDASGHSGSPAVTRSDDARKVAFTIHAYKSGATVRTVTSDYTSTASYLFQSITLILCNSTRLFPNITATELHLNYNAHGETPRSYFSSISIFSDTYIFPVISFCSQFYSSSISFCLCLFDFYPLWR